MTDQDYGQEAERPRESHIIIGVSVVVTMVAAGLLLMTFV